MAGVLLMAMLSHEASADVGNPAGKMQLLQQEQAVRREHMLVRPTSQEREAIKTLINMKPRPKTFTEVDVKYLKGLLDKAAWMGGNNGSYTTRTTSTESSSVRLLQVSCRFVYLSFPIGSLWRLGLQLSNG